LGGYLEYNAPMVICNDLTWEVSRMRAGKIRVGIIVSENEGARRRGRERERKMRTNGR
jgi:hypothetical protein